MLCASRGFLGFIAIIACISSVLSFRPSSFSIGPVCRQRGRRNQPLVCTAKHRQHNEATPTVARTASLHLNRQDFFRFVAAIPLVVGGMQDSAEAFLDEKEVQVKQLTMDDMSEFLKLSQVDAAWDDTNFDVKLLLQYKGARSFGVFKNGKLASMATVTYLPAADAAVSGGRDTLWLSYVVTATDMRRMGLAKRACQEAVAYADKAYPKLPFGLYGEPVKAGPMYESLGFADVGRTYAMQVKVDPMQVLREDGSIVRNAQGKLEVPTSVERITVGRTTAIALRGEELSTLIRKADAVAFAGDRGDALVAWAKEFPDMCWVVKDVDETKVKELFDKFCEETKDGKRVTLKGFQDLAANTQGPSVSSDQFEAFCARSGCDPKTGFTREALSVLYALATNDIETDYAKVFPGKGRALPTRLKGYALGRSTTEGYYLGPVVADDEECATALLLATVRGGCVQSLAAGKTGKIPFKIMSLEGMDATALSPTKAGVLLSLGFEPLYSARFMVRNGDVKSFYGGDFSKIYGASSYEFA